MSAIAGNGRQEGTGFKTLPVRWLQVRGLLVLGLLGGMSACAQPGLDIDEDTEKEDDAEDGVSTCAPTISDLSVAKGTAATGAIYARLTFSYDLPGCGGGIESASVRAKVTNLDAPDPTTEDAYDIFDLPTSSALVSLDTSASTIAADFDFSKVSTTTTFEFSLRLIDSLGYVSNTLTEEVVYADITDSI